MAAQTILVVGGAGYIGSHMVRRIIDAGHTPIILDHTHETLPLPHNNCQFIHADCADDAVLDHIFTTHSIDAVMHFAAHIQVGESCIDPAKYYANNIGASIHLLNAMARHHIRSFIFSSSAAIFGTPTDIPIKECHPLAPITPYGRSKYVIEQLLPDYAHAYGLRFACLRYFNAAGAMPDSSLGELHHPETHLIPLILRVASGRSDAIEVFGNTHATPDGTCIRDYIHVCDLTDAHLLALDYLTTDAAQAVHFNLGTGTGYSVQEVISAARKITGHPIPTLTSAARIGDPPILIADGSKARALLHWNPRYSDLDTIIRHAWQWEQKLCNNTHTTPLTA